MQHSAFLDWLEFFTVLVFAVDLLRANGLEGLPSYMPPLDMPLYPFNHSQKYWIESSLSRNLRFRETPRHDLLGTRALDWNPHMAVWRNVMRLGELPWLEDHKIGTNAVLPAAAILAIATEAQKEISGNATAESCCGIHIHSAIFSHAISFPPGVHTAETQFTLAPSSQIVDSRVWSEFRLFVVEGGSYVECARGFVRMVTDKDDRESIASRRNWKRNGTLGDWVRGIENSCYTPVEDPYRALEGTELRYGPSFQNLSAVTVERMARYRPKSIPNPGRQKVRVGRLRGLRYTPQLWTELYNRPCSPCLYKRMAICPR